MGVVFQPQSVFFVIRATGCNQSPESNGMIGLIHVRKLMDDDVIQHFRRYHDQTPVEGQGVGGGTASPSGALVADGNLFGMQVKCCRQ